MARFVLSRPKQFSSQEEFMKRKMPLVTVALSLSVLLASAVGSASVCWVEAGNNAGLLGALGACNVIVITQPLSATNPGTNFFVPVTLTNAQSQIKIMAAPGAAAVWDVPGDVFTLMPGAQDVILENLVITSDSSMIPGAGVHVTGDASVKIINCQINHKSDGVLIDSENGEAVAEIEGSRLLNNFFGIHMTGFGGHATLDRTQIRNNDSGVRMEGVRAGIKVWHSMLDKNSSYGIFVGSTNAAVLTNNEVSLNGGDGILFTEGSRGSVSFNTVAFNRDVGINNLAGGAVLANPGHNTVSNNGTDVVGILPFQNQIGG
jgi:parallel beta-helix repeat protein